MPQEYSRIHPTFHTSKLREYKPNNDKKFPSRAFTKPPPLIFLSDSGEEEEEHVIDYIVDCRKRRRHPVEYKIRWKGWGAEEDTWVNEEDLHEDLRADYHILHDYPEERPKQRKTSPKKGRKKVHRKY
jgi:hypothetical protein